MNIQTDPAAPESHALHLQSQALFLAVLPRQGDPTTRAHYAVPGQSLPALQRPHGQTGCARESGGVSHLAVSDHPSSRNKCNHRSKTCERGHLYTASKENCPRPYASFTYSVVSPPEKGGRSELDRQLSSSSSLGSRLGNP